MKNHNLFSLRVLSITLLCLSFNLVQLFAEPLELDLDISKLKLGEKINNNSDSVAPGLNKNVYAIEGHDNLVALESRYIISPLEKELTLYRQLYFFEHKALEIFPKVVRVEGRKVLLAKRYLYGSKSNLEFYLSLNENTVKALSEIDQRLKQKGQWIKDLQFLMNERGDVVVADPFGFSTVETGEFGYLNDPFKALEKNLSVVVGKLKKLPPGERVQFTRGGNKPINLLQNLIKHMPEREKAWTDIFGHLIDKTELDSVERIRKQITKRPIRNQRPAANKPSRTTSQARHK